MKLHVLQLRKTHFACVLVTLLGGCGNGQKPNYSDLDLVDVTGTVKVNGEPVGDAVVVFEDVASGTQSYGLSDANGSYRLWFNSEKRGAIPGEKVVQVSTTRKILGLNSDEEGGGEESEEGPAQETKVEAIPEVYTDSKSPLRVTVDSSHSSFDFDLNPDGTTTTAE